MDGDLDGTAPVAEYWFEPDDARRFAVLLRQMIMILALVVVVVGVIFMVSIHRRVRTSEQFEDRQFVAALAAADAEARPELAATAGRELLIAGPTSTRLMVTARLPGEDARTWLEAVGDRARRARGGLFESIDPDGDTWWHAVAPIGDGTVIVIQRRASQALATSYAMMMWVGALGGVLFLGLAVLWLVLRARVETSTKVLLDAAEDLRLRGVMRPDMRDRLTSIPERPLELKRLARSLENIERDVRTSFGQVDSLLRAARVLGRTLDPDDVLDQTLEQLEEVLGATRSAILSFDPHRGAFVVLATRGHTEGYLEELTERGFDPSAPSARAIREQVPVQVSDTESEFATSDLRQRARAHGYRSVLAVPLPATSERATVLLLHKPTPYGYSHDEIELSVSFANLASVALTNAELFAQIDEDLRQQTSRLTAIVESVDHGIIVTSLAGNVMYANSAMCALLPLGEVLEKDMSASLFIASVLTQSPDSMVAYDAVLSLPDDPDQWIEIEIDQSGRRSTLRVRSFNVADGRGQSIGSGQVWTDVTADRALDRMKSGLLATVSHEFRTPLALIKGYATTLLAGDVDWDSGDRTEFLELVSAEADRLTGLVQRLLDMRRIDAGMVELQRVPIELDDLIASALAGVPHLRSRIIVSAVPRVEVSVDCPRIVTALRNLIDNACTYAPAETLVEVEIVSDDENVEFSVRDSGPGVPDALKLRIFDTFVRADGGLTAQHTGLGLGLAIAQGFVEAHGGHIWVEDREPGPGSVFCMRVPTSRPTHQGSDKLMTSRS